VRSTVFVHTVDQSYIKSLLL